MTRDLMMSNPAADPEHREVVHRIRRTALVSTIVLSLTMWLFSGLAAALALVCSAVLMVMNFVWLEEIIVDTLQPSPDVNPLYMAIRILLRFGLVAISVMVTVLVARFDQIAVLLGFSVIVIGIFGEAVYGLIGTVQFEKNEEDRALIDADGSGRD